MSNTEGNPFTRQSVLLTPLDLVLTMDFALVVIPLVGVLDFYSSDPGEGIHSYAVFGGGALVLSFAGWRAKRHKLPPAPPTDNLLKRLLGLIGLSVGGLVTLVGAAATVMATGAYITDTKHEVPFGVVPGALVPLLLGHALMYGGAKIRAQRAA